MLTVQQLLLLQQRLLQNLLLLRGHQRHTARLLLHPPQLAAHPAPLVFLLESR